MLREYPRWSASMFPSLKDAELPPRGSLTGDWAKVRDTLARLQKKAKKEA